MTNKYDAEARRINMYLESALNGGKTISSADIKHVIKEKSFTQAAENARTALGLAGSYPKSSNEDEIDFWLLCEIVGGRAKLKSLSSSKHKEYQRFIDHVIFQALHEANLQSGWFEFMEAFIVLGKEPKSIAPTQSQSIYAEHVSENKNSVLVRLDKGLTADEYRKAWSGLKKFLQKPSTAQITADLLKNKIYLDRLNGLSYGQLAEKYYPNELAKDRENKTDFARDKVKKVVARFKTT